MVHALRIAALALTAMAGAPAEPAAGMASEDHKNLAALQRQFGESAPFQIFLQFKAFPGSLARLQGCGQGGPGAVPGLRDLIIEGFEHIDGFSNEALRHTLAMVYTETYLRNSLGGIRYLPYRWPGTAASVRDIGYVQMNIFFSPGEGEQTMTKERAVYLIEHELGHANDWNHSSVLTPDERIAMLFEVTSRFSQADHFRGYHESRNVVYDRSNRQNNFYLMVREYWADLAREYARNPGALRNHNPKDFELAEKWLRKLSGLETCAPTL